MSPAPGADPATAAAPGIGADATGAVLATGAAPPVEVDPGLEAGPATGTTTASSVHPAVADLDAAAAADLAPRARWRHLPLPEAPGAVRAALTDQLAGWGVLPGGDDHRAERVQDLLVVVSELVSNAVGHAATPFEVAVDLVDAGPAGDAAVVRVEVTDGCTAPPRLRRPDTDRPAVDGIGGQGLRLVAALADRWGHHTRRSGVTAGKTVWAEVGLGPAPLPVSGGSRPAGPAA